MSTATSKNPAVGDAAAADAVTTQVTPAPKRHLGCLDGLRALAALYVVLHHASRYAFDTLPPDQATLAQRLFAFLFTGG